MRCGKCDKIDGMCYLSNPPKVKCTVTNEFHYFDDECNISTSTIDVSNLVKPSICTSCMVCGETIELISEEQTLLRYGRSIHNKICDKCKRAILHIREQIED